MTALPDHPPARRDDSRMHTVEMAALRFSDLQETDPIGPGPSQPPLPTWKIALLVAAGGGLGAALRVIVALAMPTVTTPTLVEVPWATLWVNLIGCLGLGTLVGVLEIRPGRPWMRPLLGTGLCGGFTSMSTVVLEGSAMIGAEFPIPALGYAVATVVLCLGAVLTGFVLGRRLARRRTERPAAAGAQHAHDSPDDSPDPDDGPDADDSPDPDDGPDPDQSEASR